MHWQLSVYSTKIQIGRLYLQPIYPRKVKIKTSSGDILTKQTNFSVSFRPFVQGLTGHRRIRLNFRDQHFKFLYEMDVTFLSARNCLCIFLGCHERWCFIFHIDIANTGRMPPPRWTGILICVHVHLFVRVNLNMLFVQFQQTSSHLFAISLWNTTKDFGQIGRRQRLSLIRLDSLLSISFDVKRWKHRTHFNI